MRKVYIKLIALSLLLVLSMCMVAAASYAWFVMSGSPELTGLQVTIGGSNTILVAADLTETFDGTTYHYPDAFSDTLNFGTHASYQWLGELDGLTPVSTADGINWFLPAYYDSTDQEVREGRMTVGQLKEITAFTREFDLAHANLSGADSDVIAEGSYIYLDFWVVSPGADCTLRVSVGDDSSGSFLIELPQPESTTDGYVLGGADSQSAAMFRVGFLANSDTLVDHSMLYYQNSQGFDERYRSLRGFYGEPGQAQLSFDSNRFTIYEPNGDYHPGGTAEAGSYVQTSPIGLVDGVPAAVSVMDRVTVQKRSGWRMTDGGQPTIEQLFQTAIHGKTLEEEELFDYFYNDYLQGIVYAYVDKGDFYKKSSDLASCSGSAADVAQLASAGATDDVYIIELERNVPQRIRMFIWLEGQDVDCTNVTDMSSLMLYLELAGSTE